MLKGPPMIASFSISVTSLLQKSLVNCGVMQLSGVAASKQFTLNLKVCEYEPLSIVRNLRELCRWVVGELCDHAALQGCRMKVMYDWIERFWSLCTWWFLWQNTEDPPPMFIWPNIMIQITLAMLCHGWSLLHASILWEFVVASFPSLPRSDKSWVNNVVWSCDL